MELGEAIDELEFLRSLPVHDRWRTELELKVHDKEKELKVSQIMLEQEGAGGSRIIWESVVDTQGKQLAYLKSLRDDPKRAADVISQMNSGTWTLPEGSIDSPPTPS
jgi:hypothetical protein